MLNFFYVPQKMPQQKLHIYIYIYISRRFAAILNFKALNYVALISLLHISPDHVSITDGRKL